MSEEINSVLNLVFRINEETEFAAFVRISGHVDSLSVFIGKNKVSDYNEWIYNAEFYYSGELASDDMRVKGIINNLKALSEVQ